MPDVVIYLWLMSRHAPGVNKKFVSNARDDSNECISSRAEKEYGDGEDDSA
jgi:hypothetical protein